MESSKAPRRRFKFDKKTSIYLNLLGYNVSISLVFTAVNCVASIQPVMLSDPGLGATTQITIFVVQLLTSFVVPQVIVDSLGFKWSLALAEIFYLIYIAIQAVPSWYTLIPSAIGVGINQSVILYTIGTFLTLLGRNYSNITGKSFPDVQLLVYGLFGASILLSYVIGAGLVATILQSDSISSSAPFNYSASCGVWNCPNTALPETSTKPTLESVYVLCGCLVGVVLLSLVTTLIFVDNIKSEEPDTTDQIEVRPPIGARFVNEFKSIYKTHKNLDIWLLYPLSIFTGFELTFIWFEFCRAFAACLRDINFIGWSMIFFGSMGAVLSVVMVFIIKYVGKPVGIVFMLNVALTQAVFILSWTPSPNQYYLMFLMITGFALTESIATGQVRGIYGVIFPNNPSAFSAASIGQTSGFVIGCVVTLFSCVDVKTYVYIGIILASLVGFVTIEIRNKLKIERIESNRDKDMLMKLGSLDYINTIRF